MKRNLKLAIEGMLLFDNNGQIRFNAIYDRSIVQPLFIGTRDVTKDYFFSCSPLNTPTCVDYQDTNIDKSTLLRKLLLKFFETSYFEDVPTKPHYHVRFNDDMVKFHLVITKLE